MPAKPPTRCYRTYRCNCRKHTIRKSAAVTWSLKRLRAIAPKAPPCPWCGELMERCGVVYQGMLHSSWGAGDDAGHSPLWHDGGKYFLIAVPDNESYHWLIRRDCTSSWLSATRLSRLELRRVVGKSSTGDSS